MKALGILAGPRKGFATDMMMDEVLRGLDEKGVEIEKVSLYDLNIKPCTGCCQCEKTKTCFIEDDHQILLDKMDSSDVVVFATPTYWSNVTSEAKKFFDRSIRFFEVTTLGPRRFKKTPGKIVLITACGVPYPFSHLMGIATGAMRGMKSFFKYMKKTKLIPLYAPGMLDPQTSKPTKRQLSKAYKLGKKL